MSVHRRTRRRADLSQHFLRRGATAARLVRNTSISRSDFVLEIGPGRGALTRPLLARAGRLAAIELDHQLCSELRAEFGDRIELVQGDFLRTELPAAPYKVLGNLPFARTTDIVRKIVEAPNPPEDAWIILQREAGLRFAGSPYARETLWSLRLKPWWHVEILEQLRNTDFDPPPSVESVLLWLNRRPRPLVSSDEARLYHAFIEHAFKTGIGIDVATRRWLTRTQLKRLSRALRFEPKDAPSRLRFEQWLGLHRFVARLR